MIGTHIAQYRIEAELGRGGMGVVYRARDSRLNRDVAVKTLHPRFARDAEGVNRLEREAHLLAALNHPNIAAIYGLEEAADAHHLILEYVPGETLAERVRGRRMHVAEALRVAVAIAAALEAAHERGIVHRDLKPENVKITPDDKVKVLDFGLAKAVGVDTPGPDLSEVPTATSGATLEGVVLGTVPYMSPEQTRGRPLDKRTDIWAFGCVLYEMLTGRAAFAGATHADTIASILGREPDWSALPAETPDRVRLLLRRCLEKDAAHRLRDIGDARFELDESLVAPAEASTAAAGGRERRPAIARLAPWAIAVAGGLLGAWSLLRPVAGPVAMQVARFAIQLPPDAGLSALDQPVVAVSPDGTMLAYAARRNGVSRLYLRRLDQLEPMVLPGTEGAEGPFFSPDGQSLGFLAGRDLKRVSLQGGAPVTMARVPPILCGASWGPDDSVLVGLGLGNFGLARIAAIGSSPDMVTSLEAGAGETSHCWPEVLPGGRAALFVINTGRPAAESTIAALDLASGKKQILIDGGTSPHYVSTGHLLFVRAGVLEAAPFDVSRLELTGPAVPLLSEMQVNQRTGAAQLAVTSGGTLAYVAGEAAAARRSLVRVDRRGNAQALPLEGRNFLAPSFSPDGTRIAAEIDADNDDVWIYDLARHTLSRVTAEPSHDAFPFWTPDGTGILFSSDRNRRPHDLFLQSLEDGRVQQLSPPEHGSYPQFGASISPDGRWLAYCEDHILLPRDPTATGWDVLLRPMQGENKRIVYLQTPFDETTPMFSPDGRWIAYVSNETGRWEVYVRAFPVPGKKWQISNEGGEEPRWARDGRELFYRNGDRMMAVGVDSRPDFHAGKPSLLFEGSFLAGARNPGFPSYDVSPDGQWFVMVRNDQEPGPRRIHVTLNWLGELGRPTPQWNTAAR